MDFLYWLLIIAGSFSIIFIVAFILKLYYDEGGFGLTKIEKELARREIEAPKVEYFQAKALKKEVRIYYASEINIPKSVTEFRILFLFEDGRKQEFSLSQEMFEKIKEEQKGTLVLLNGIFFDFGDGEDVETSL